MQIEVDIDPANVNQAISAAIVGSELGKAIKTHMEKFLNKDSGMYGGHSLAKTMESAVQNELQKIVMGLIDTEYGDRIREQVRQRLTVDVVEGLVDKAFSTFMKRY